MRRQKSADHEFREDDPIGNDARRTRRSRALGQDAQCLLCGYDDPASLIVVNRSLLEAHHVAGKRNDPSLTVDLCRNCHAEVTEGGRDLGLRLRRPANASERAQGLLRGLAAFLPRLGETCLRTAHEVAELESSIRARLQRKSQTNEVP